MTDAIISQQVVTFGENLNFSFDRIDKAIAKIGTTAKASMILRYGTWNLDSNIIITNNISFTIPPGAVLGGAFTLTIKGHFEGYKGCFASELAVVFYDGSVDEVLPKWFNEDASSQTRTRASIAVSGIPIYMGKIADDPTTTGWGAPESGTRWYNLSGGIWKWWDGSAVVEMTGGTGAVDHGTLTGLTDDDHTQYFEATRLAAKIGVSLQAYDADLDWLSANITAAGKAILDDANAAAQRTTLGAAASGANTDITSLTGLTTSGGNPLAILYTGEPTVYNLKLNQDVAAGDVYWTLVHRNNNIDYPMIIFRKGMATISNICSNNGPVFDVRAFGAVADSGVTDNTTAFAAAIAAAHALGSGTVFVPDTGTGYFGFGAAGKIVLSRGVNLIGQSTWNSFVRTHGGTPGFGLGSILGVTNTTNVFLQVSGEGAITSQNVIKGLTFYYPNQTQTNPPIPYPATIGPEDSGNCDVEISDCVLVNPYIGIQFSSYQMCGVKIDKISMDSLNLGIDIDKMVDFCHITNIFDHVSIWSENANLIAYQKANAVGINLRGGYFNLDNISLYWKLAGLVLDISSAPTITAGPTGNISNLSLDQMAAGIIIRHTHGEGVNFSNVWMGSGDNYGILIEGANAPRVQFVNTKVLGFLYGFVCLVSAEIYLTNFRLTTQGTISLYLDYADASLVNGYLVNGANIGSNMVAFKMIGGKVAGSYTNNSPVKRIVAVTGLSDV